MEDFVVRRRDGTDGKWYMYIGFHERRPDCDHLINCYGSAVIIADGDKQYCFNYSFHHSSDWKEIRGMSLTPIKKYKISLDEITDIASDILYNIQEFISKMN